jgi:hypothetical protein
MHRARRQTSGTLAPPFTVGRSRGMCITITQAGAHVVSLGGCLSALHEVMPRLLTLIASDRSLICAPRAGRRQGQMRIRGPLEIECGNLAERLSDVPGQSPPLAEIR